MKEIQLTGNYFDAGYALGKAMRDAIRGYLRHDRAALRTSGKKYKKQITRTHALINRDYPQCMDEMRGIAAGADVPITDVLLENMPELLYKDSGCTTVAVKNTFGNFIVHNEDESAWKRNDNYALVHYHITGLGNVHAFCSPPELSGNAFGWNDYIFYAVDYVPILKMHPGGIPRSVESRGMLEQKSITEAIRYLNGFISMSGLHYTIGEFGTGAIVSIERRHDKISVVEVKKIARHTNHFVHKKFARPTAPRGIDESFTRLRLNRIDKHINANQAPKAVVAMMRKYVKRPLNGADVNKTFATVSAELTRGIITVVA